MPRLEARWLGLPATGEGRGRRGRSGGGRARAARRLVGRDHGGEHERGLRVASKLGGCYALSMLPPPQLVIRQATRMRNSPHLGVTRTIVDDEGREARHPGRE
jgi:hypothetical protein